MEDALAYLLDLRVQVRGNAEATAVVDRCLMLLARAQVADMEEAKGLDVEIEALRAELQARFGPRAPVRVN